ncbi:MAG: amino acid--tRNA ligase-related protein, partial [Nanoarchaeota archaeon]
MSRQDEIIKDRMKKIEQLRKIGINPYPHKFNRTHTSAEIKKEFSEIKTDSTTKNKASIAGRLMIIRDIGKIIFAKLRDGSGDIQIVLQEGKTSGKEFDFFRKYIDSGDFIGVSGDIGKTKTGELSVIADKLTMLSKSILPLPEKWHGLTDKEERYRKRYIDLAMNPDVRRVFEARSQIINSIRKFLDKKGFIETDTPILQPLYGGGAARPFVSELNSLKMQVYMAISKELYLKRLIVGGMEKVYEMNRIFRNEGIDATHNPEFTMLETMWAYVDYNSNMDLFEEMIEQVANEVLGKTKITYQNKEIELKRPWPRLTMFEAIKKYAKIDIKK